MQQASTLTVYTGPRPSPARRFVPAVIALLVAAALGNVVLLVLNVIERHNLTQRKAGHPVSQTFFDDTISTLNAAGRITAVATLAFVVVAVTWSVKRRSRRRVREEGESAVEPSIAVVSRGLYAAFWVMLALALLAFEIANASKHVPMTDDDFIRFRTFTAVGYGFRVVMWGLYAGLVVKATRQQDQREVETSAPVAV